MKNLLLFALLFTSLMACRKDSGWPGDPDRLVNETIIEGHVLDPWGEPISGALVNCNVLAGQPYGNTWNYWLPHTYTDSSGYYRFHDENTKDVIQYGLRAYKDGYYEAPNNTSYPNYRQTEDFELRPHAWIRVHFTNVNYFNEWDKCIYYLISFYLHEPIGVYGNAKDEIRLFKGAGGTPSTMHWNVTKNNILTTFKDTVILPGHDTLDYYIHF